MLELLHGNGSSALGKGIEEEDALFMSFTGISKKESREDAISGEHVGAAAGNCTLLRLDGRFAMVPEWEGTFGISMKESRSRHDAFSGEQGAGRDAAAAIECRASC